MVAPGLMIDLVRKQGLGAKGLRTFHREATIPLRRIDGQWKVVASLELVQQLGATPDR